MIGSTTYGRTETTMKVEALFGVAVLSVVWWQEGC